MDNDLNYDWVDYDPNNQPNQAVWDLLCIVSGKEVIVPLVYFVNNEIKTWYKYDFHKRYPNIEIIKIRPTKF